MRSHWHKIYVNLFYKSENSGTCRLACAVATQKQNSGNQFLPAHCGQSYLIKARNMHQPGEI